LTTTYHCYCATDSFFKEGGHESGSDQGSDNDSFGGIEIDKEAGQHNSEGASGLVVPDNAILHVSEART
jgi:hypothetical protein